MRGDASPGAGCVFGGVSGGGQNGRNGAVEVVLVALVVLAAVHVH